METAVALDAIGSMLRPQLIKAIVIAVIQLVAQAHIVDSLVNFQARITHAVSMICFDGLAVLLLQIAALGDALDETDGVGVFVSIYPLVNNKSLFILADGSLVLFDMLI